MGLMPALSVVDTFSWLVLIGCSRMLPDALGVPKEDEDKVGETAGGGGKALICKPKGAGDEEVAGGFEDRNASGSSDCC